MKFYRCELCGNLVEKIKDSGMPMTCCGQEMKELIPCSSDGALEAHVPVCSVNGNKVKVHVGEKEHPMLEEHYIEWIVIETDRGVYRICLKPGCEPRAKFLLADGECVRKVYAYCNIHGLWMAEMPKQ